MNRTHFIVAAAGTLLLVGFLARPTDQPVFSGPPLVNGGALPSHLDLTPPGGRGIAGESVVATGGSLELRGKLSGSHVHTSASEILAQVDVTAITPASEVRHPVNLALALDRSGSMCGEKFWDARKAALHLVSLLGPEDRLAIVHYGSDLTEFPSSHATPAGKEALSNFLNEMQCGGSTFTSGALRRAGDLVRPHAEGFRATRVILVSDGRPTQGLTSAYELGRLASNLAESGVGVSALGVGADFDERLMSTIAQEGAGLFGYLRDGERMIELFAAELRMASGMAARQIALELAPTSGVTVLEVLGQQTSTEGGKTIVQLRDHRVGQTTRVIARLQVDGGRSGTTRELVKVAIRYQDTLADQRRQQAASLRGTFESSTQIVSAHLDEEVRVAGLRHIGAKQLAIAAQAVSEGRREDALQIFDNVRALFGASTQALSGDFAELEADRRKVENANGKNFSSYGKDFHEKSTRTFGSSY